MKDIRKSIIRMNQLKYTDFGGMLITPENVKLTFNNEITLGQAEEILVRFYSENWKYINDFSLKLFKEFYDNKENNKMGYSYFKLLDKDQVPQLYAVRLRDEIAHFMNQTEGKEIDSVKLIINSIDGIDDPNKNISRETLTINTAFRLLALIMRNSSTFLPILGLSTLKPIYHSPINVIVTLKNGEQIRREIFTNRQKYFEPKHSQ